MTKKNDLVWRLKEAPNVNEITMLKRDGIINDEEARELLFSTTDSKKEIKSLKSEVNFLRELVEKLSGRANYYLVWTTINTQPFRQYPWYPTYSGTFGGTTNAIASSALSKGSLTASSGTVGMTAVTLPRY